MKLLPAGKPDSFFRMSFSQLTRFVECPASAMANLRGEWEYPESNALLVGSYFHSAFESDAAFQKLIAESSEKIFQKRNGKKYADFIKADSMIERIRKDKTAMFFMSGRHEVKIDGEIDGVHFVAKIDCLNEKHHFFADLKSVAEMRAGEWIEFTDRENGYKRRKKVSFIEARKYHWQMAIYQELIRQNFGSDFLPVIVAASKQDFPDLEVVAFDDQPELNEYLAEVADLLPEIMRIKNGEIEPKRCGLCAYCRSTKKIKNMLPFREFKQEID